VASVSSRLIYIPILNRWLVTSLCLFNVSTSGRGLRELGTEIVIRESVVPAGNVFVIFGMRRRLGSDFRADGWTK
jgi:hypothetical protein